MLVSAGLVLVPLIMLADQHSLAGEVADEAGHQHPMHQHAGQGTPVPDSCSISILICHTCQVDGLSYWILTTVCSKSERSDCFVYIKKKIIIKLFTSTCECCIYIFVYLV